MSEFGSIPTSEVDGLTARLLGVSPEEVARRFADFGVVRTPDCLTPADAIQQNALDEPMVVLLVDETADGTLITPHRGEVPFGQPWVDTEVRFLDEDGR